MEENTAIDLGRLGRPRLTILFWYNRDSKRFQDLLTTCPTSNRLKQKYVQTSLCAAICCFFDPNSNAYLIYLSRYINLFFSVTVLFCVIVN